MALGYQRETGLSAKQLCAAFSATFSCLAVRMCFAAHNVTGKVFAIIFPNSGFVVIGFEHSVANMLLKLLASWLPGSEIGVLGFRQNLLPVTLGKVIGGGGLLLARVRTPSLTTIEMSPAC